MIFIFAKGHEILMKYTFNHLCLTLISNFLEQCLIFSNIFDWRQEAAPQNWLKSRWPEIRLPCRNQPSFKEMKIEFSEYNNTTLWKRLIHILHLYISLNSLPFHIWWKMVGWWIDSLIGWEWLLEAFGSEEKSSSRNI